jgi:hypothetical protein
MRAWVLQRRRALAVAITVIASIWCYYFFRTTAVRYMARSQGLATPFVLQRDIYHYAQNPAGVLAMRETIGRRSDGTTVEIRTVGLPAGGLQVRRIKFMDGSWLDLADFLRIRMAWPAGPEWRGAHVRARILSPPSNCVFVGYTLIKEQDAVIDHGVTVIRYDDAGNGMRATTWAAPDLGCADLQYRVEERQPDGSYKLLTLAKPVSLQLLEPDSRLFQEGQDYAEVRPSEFERRVDARVGHTLPSESSEFLEKLYDQLSAAHR